MRSAPFGTANSHLSVRTQARPASLTRRQLFACATMLPAIAVLKATARAAPGFYAGHAAHLRGWRAPRVVVYAGRGLAAESTLLTSKTPDGVWLRFAETEAAYHVGAERDHARMASIFEIRQPCHIIDQPGPAHLAFALLQAGLATRGGWLLVCTETFDDLYERAGLLDVIYLSKMRCFSCRVDMTYRAEIGRGGPCPYCGACDRSNVFIPNWGGARHLDERRVMSAIVASDLVVRIGARRSLTAAMMERRASQTGTPRLILNPSDDGRNNDIETRFGPLDTIVPAWAAEILARSLIRASV